MGVLMSFSWVTAADELREIVKKDAGKPLGKQRLDDGQRASLTWMADRLPQSGVVLADEVGTGKTRIACAVVHAVLKAGGRAAVVVPHGLMHQWIAESRKLCATSPAPKELTTLTTFLQEGSSKTAWNERKPCPDEPEWWLISHGFRTPLVRSNTDVWRVALPAFVQLHLASPDVRKDGRTRIGKLQRAIKRVPKSPWGWNGMARIAQDVAPRVRKLQRLRLLNRINKLPPLDVSNWNNDALRAQFGNGGNGRPLTEDLLGLWLGKFDLLVIDEAHKSRGEVEVEDTDRRAASGKVLVRLVDNILKQNKDGRRLCLTATPMELDLSQWLNLLGRARCGINNAEGEKVVNDLHEAALSAAVAPDEGIRLDKLCEAAKEFTKTLAPYVTRRRRDEDPLVTKFREGAKLQEGRAHTHRCLQRVQIEWTKTVGQNSSWLDVLFKAECMSQSARGLNRKLFESAIQLSGNSSDEKTQKRLKHLIRDMYVRLASGHLSADIFDADVRIVPPVDCEDVARGKLQRTEYWRAGIQKAMSGLHQDEHPRILAAVKEIEGWTQNGEKVLVFGVFLHPLRLLRDVLNVRHALRAADAGRPIAHAIRADNIAEGVLKGRLSARSNKEIHADNALSKIALRQLDRLRAEGLITDRLSAVSDEEEMLDVLDESHRDYENLRKSVRSRAKKQVVAWSKDPLLLGGALDDSALKGALEDHLVSFVLDDFLAKTSVSGKKVSNESFKTLSDEFVEERLRPLLGELGDEDIEEKQAALRQKSLRALLADDDSHQSLHARLLQGGTRWQTRRYLQAAFNRSGGSPWVLIAQSQVGREGLNLHESCRVVVQFHAEWNPAILEQQIGRVDRKGSRWERLAREWLEDGKQGEPPFVEVRQLVFEGTYDAFQWDGVMRRQHVFDASLFGSLLPANAWDRVPEDRLNELNDCAPRFHP